MATTAIEDLPADVLANALRRLDGPSLAAACCATTGFRALLSSRPDLWRDLCLSTWPSHRLLPALPFSHRSFFSDAHPFPLPHLRPDPTDHIPTELISAVDIYHKGVPIFSQVVQAETSSPWFHCSPFRIDALDRSDAAPVADPVSSPVDLALSWVVIDPIGRRAVNVSSRRPVAVDRHWFTGETQVRFGLVLEGCFVGVVVTSGEKTGHVREVSLSVEDMDGKCLDGRASLVILKRAMAGGRGRVRDEEAKEKYEEYVRKKSERKERKLTRERRLDTVCTLAGISAFTTLWVLAFIR